MILADLGFIELDEVLIPNLSVPAVSAHLAKLHHHFQKLIGLLQSVSHPPPGAHLGVDGAQLMRDEQSPG